MPRTIKEGLKGHWLRVLDDFAESDCSVSEYCQHLNISRAALYRWSKKLGVPIKDRDTAKELPEDQKGVKGAQPITPESETPFSFIDLSVPPYPDPSTPVPVKFELLLAQGRSLKIEAPSSWEGVIGLAKALAS
jgi:hypothetical protein